MASPPSTLAIAPDPYFASEVEPAYQSLKNLSKALADDLRLVVLRALRAHSLNVNELCEVADIRQSALSHHLKILASAGLLQARKEGNSTYYRRATAFDPRLTRMITEAFSLLDSEEPAPSLVKGLAVIDERRSEQAKRFFDRRAGGPASEQDEDLIANFELYGEPCEQLLRRLVPQVEAPVLEVGPGDGDFLALIASDYINLCAVDISAGSIEKSHKLLAAKGFDHVVFHHGEIDSVPADPSFRAVICNMVLHHTSSPRQVLEGVHSKLDKHGYLIISELCKHEQSWARETCGDIWLGFDAHELIADAAAAGFTHLSQTLIAQRKGFQIQIQVLQKR